MILLFAFLIAFPCVYTANGVQQQPALDYVLDAQGRPCPLPLQPDPNPFVEMLNHWHFNSSRYWQHQETIKDSMNQNANSAYRRDGLLPPLPVDIVALGEDIGDEYDRRKRSDLLPTRLGTWTEGVGELADILSTTTTNPKWLKFANWLALISRSADVVMGSFPQLPILRGERPRPRFWGTRWRNHHTNEFELTPWHIGTHLANQAGKAWDIQRAAQRIKNSKILAWYNKNHLSKGKKNLLHVVQALQATALIAGLYFKHIQKDKLMSGQYRRINDPDQWRTSRYPWLIGEAITSLLRRLILRGIQSNLLSKARDAWEEKELNEIS